MTAALGATHAAPALGGVSPFGVRATPALVGVGPAGHVALTFDDGPDPVSTPVVLGVLDDLGWRATFFMLGEMVRRFPDTARAVVDAGHEVAVHGDAHRNMLRRLPSTTRADITRGYETIAEVTGVEAHWFRPPFGISSFASMRTASQLGMRTVLWTTWGRDWRKEATRDTVVADVLRRYVDGGTVLLHDTDGQSYPQCWRATVAALPVLADELSGRGLKVGPVGEHDVGSVGRRLRVTA